MGFEKIGLYQSSSHCCEEINISSQNLSIEVNFIYMEVTENKKMSRFSTLFNGGGSVVMSDRKKLITLVRILNCVKLHCARIPCIVLSDNMGKKFSQSDYNSGQYSGPGRRALPSKHVDFTI